MSGFFSAKHGAPTRWELIQSELCMRNIENNRQEMGIIYEAIAKIQVRDSLS